MNGHAPGVRSIPCFVVMISPSFPLHIFHVFATCCVCMYGTTHQLLTPCFRRGWSFVHNSVFFSCISQVLVNCLDIARVCIPLAISSGVSHYSEYLAMRDVCFRKVGTVIFCLRNHLVGSKMNGMFPEVRDEDAKRFSRFNLLNASCC